MEKNLEYFKEIVAKAWQYENWKQATNITSLQMLKHIQNLNDEAAEAYAKHREAVAVDKSLTVVHTEIIKNDWSSFTPELENEILSLAPSIIEQLKSE